MNTEHKDQNNNPLRIGDPVTFLKVTTTSGGFRFRSIEGTVLRFDRREGKVVAVVKLARGGAALVAIENLRRSDLGPSELTEAFTQGRKA